MGSVEAEGANETPREPPQGGDGDKEIEALPKAEHLCFFSLVHWDPE